MSLGAFLRYARCGPTVRLACPRMAYGCSGSGTMLFVPLGSVRSWFAFGICRLLWNMVVDPVVALVGVGRLTEID